MFDKQRLRNQLLFLLACGVLCGLGGYEAGYVMCTIAFFLLFPLYLSFRPLMLPRKVIHILEPIRTRQSLRERVKTDRDFGNAVYYAYNLSPEDFLIFVSTIVEMRYEADQEALRDVADLFRIGDKFK